MYGGKFAFQKLTELACSGKEIYHFCFVLLCIRGQIPRISPPGGLYSAGRFNGGFFALRFWGAYIWRGLFSEFYGMSARHRFADCFRNRANINGRVLNYGSLLCQQKPYGMVFVPAEKLSCMYLVPCVNIYSLSQDFNEN